MRRPPILLHWMVTALSGVLVSGACSDRTGAAVAAPGAPVSVSGPLAFANAVGYGAGSKGGRLGRVLVVDTLSDRGPGSLRACMEAEGPRVCVFRVAGVIRFETPAVIHNPYLTIAGQTAPGGGITLAHVAGPSGRTPLLIKGSHDVVVQDIRVRNDVFGGSRGSEDSITIENSDNVIIDHVSASWARDELVNGYGDNGRVTVSNSIFAQGIPRHDKCALLASDPVRPQKFSFINNLCAHNGDRNPDIKFPLGSCSEVINNIFYNAESQFTEIWENFGATPVSVVGNIYRAGPNTSARTEGIARNTIGTKGVAAIYLWDNRFDGDFVHIAPSVDPSLVKQPSCPLTVRPMPVNEAYEFVLRSAGAWPRDAFDALMVRQTKRQTGHIDKRKQPGTIPPIDVGAAYPDADRDGMDDSWERAHGADPTRFDAWSHSDRDGMSNLDRFLADRLQQLMANSEAS
jgi:pectate lyase